MTTFASPHIIEDLKLAQPEIPVEKPSHYDYFFSSMKAHFSIRIFGDFDGQDFNRTFHCGDLAECGGYGELGRITDICGGGVTFERNGEIIKTAIDEFIWRNRDLPDLI